MKKHKNLKRTLAVSAAFCLAATGITGLSGCGGDDANSQDVVVDMAEDTQEAKSGQTSADGQGNQAMGRYLEEDVGLPQGCIRILNINFLDDGSLGIIYWDQDYLLRFSKSADKGETWEEGALLTSLLGTDGEEAEQPYQTALAKDGSFFAEIADGDSASSDSISYTYYYYSANGEAKILEIDDLIGNGLVWSGQFGENGNLFLNVIGKGVLEIDPADASLVHTYEDGSHVEFMGVTDKYLALVVDGTVHYYDIGTGNPTEGGDALTQQISSDENNLYVTNSSSVPILFLNGDDEDTIFYADASGLYRFAFGGNVVEKVIDGSLNSMSAPDIGYTGITKDADGNFYISASDSSSGGVAAKLFCYTYSDDTPTVPDTELKVYALEDNSFIRQAASVFQKEYPDVYLNIEIGMTGDDAVTATDALKTLNTEIMAGKGPDILILDGIPSDTYVEKGMLEDLSGILSDAGLLENIKDAYTQEDGAIYTMPVKFGIPLIQGTQEDLDKVTDLATLADVLESHQEEYGTSGTALYKLPLAASLYPRSMLECLADTSSASWQKEDGTLDEEKIRDFLEQVNRISQTAANGLEEIKEAYPDFEISYDMGYERTYGIGSEASQMISGMYTFALGWLYSPYDLSCLNSVEEDFSSLAHKVWDGQSQNCFLPVNTVGISSKSSEKETAEKFVQFLFSEDGQMLTRHGGFPVTQSVYDGDAYWDQGEEGTALTEGTSSYVDDSGAVVEYTYQTRVPSAEVVDSLKELGKTLTTPVKDNTVILNAVSDAGVRCMNGEISLEEAADAVIREVNLYLSE